MPSAAAVVIDAGEDDGEQAADGGTHRLTQCEARADLAAGDRHEARRTVHRREAEYDEHGRHDREQSSLPHHRASTSRRNVAPRSS